MDLKLNLSGVQLAFRASVAAGTAFALAQFAGLEYPLFAFVAAVIATDLVPSQSRYLALNRLVATVIGATSGAALSYILAAGAVSLGCSILIAMLICYVLQGPDGFRLAGYVSGIVVLEHGADPWIYAFNRSLETGLGVSVAVAFSFFPLLIRFDDPASPGSGDLSGGTDSQKP